MVTEQHKHQLVIDVQLVKNNQMEPNENITPALYDIPPNQMSSKEFQSMLYTWFEEKGLVADLRSYLRVLMIKKLRNTTVGKVDPNKANFSLSKQAFSLVIAEHLLREGCHYTLSIFSTEVPGVASQLPFSLFDAHCNKENESWRFDQDSVLNVLELIGVSKNTNESLRIAALYFRNYGSLLTCMVGSKTVDSVQHSNIENKDDEDADRYLNRVLSVMGVPSNITAEVRKRIQRDLLQEKDKNNLSTQQHFGELIEELKTQLLVKDSEIRRLIDGQVAQKKDNKKLKDDLKETRKRLNQLILQEKSIKMKEKLMKEKLDDISKLEHGLKDAFVNKDKNKTTEACPNKHCTESCLTQVQLNGELQKKISKQQEVDRDKTVEIERLNSKISSLVRDLQSSQAKIEFLNSCLLRYNQINLRQGSSKASLGDDLSDASSDLTEEILKNVRSKLQQLERESDALDVKLRKLKIK